MSVRVYTYDLTLNEDETAQAGQDRIDAALAAAGIFADIELISVVDESGDVSPGPDTRCLNCDELITDEDGYRHEGAGFVHKYCPEEGEGEG